MGKATYNWEKNQDKEIQGRIMAGWAAYAKHCDISSKATLPSDWRDRCTTPVCCQLWHMVQRPGHWPNKHRTKNVLPHRPKGTEVGLCSTWHTKTERPTFGSDRSHRYNQPCENNEVFLGRAHQPPERRPMHLECHHAESIRQGRPAKRWRYNLDNYRSDTIWQRTVQNTLTWRPSPNHGTPRLSNLNQTTSVPKPVLGIAVELAFSSTFANVPLVTVAPTQLDMVSGIV